VRRRPDAIGAALAAMLWATPVVAAHCRFPQVLIRHLGECVSPRSQLAMAYVTIGRWRFPILPRPAPAPPKRVYAGPPLLPDEYPARPVSRTPAPMPELEAGAPPIWRICIEHHEWCHSEGGSQ
jgi:hypothetical protein